MAKKCLYYTLYRDILKDTNSKSRISIGKPKKFTENNTKEYLFIQYKYSGNADYFQWRRKT